MDKERKKRRETVRLIVTEILMVIVVIVTVVVLTFLAMGYNVNKDGDLAQSGLVQIRTQPTGAAVAIDGDELLSRTNTNRMLSAGEHKISLAKEGYEGWEKTVNVEPGWLLKLEYPRLFLQDRTAEKVREYADNFTVFSVAPDREQLLYARENSTKWVLLDIRGDEVEEKELDLTGLLKNKTVKEVIWNKNSDRVLLKTEAAGELAFIVVNTKNVAQSVNITEEFGLKFSEMSFATDAGERLYAVENGNLRTIGVSERTLSQVLAANVKEYYNRGTELVYLTNKQELKLYQDGAEDVLLSKFGGGQKVKMAISEYLSKKYLTVIVDGRIFVYRGAYPTADNSLAEMELLAENDLGFSPEELYVQAEGGLIVASSGADIAVFDAELSALSLYSLESDKMFFVDEYLIGNITEGKLVIRDFDNTNRREMSAASGRAVIAKNNKYIYYVSKVNEKTNIFREKI